MFESMPSPDRPALVAAALARRVPTGVLAYAGLAMVVAVSTSVGAHQAHLGAWFAGVACVLGLVRLFVSFRLNRLLSLSRAGSLRAFRLGAIGASLFWGGSAAYLTSHAFDSNAVVMLVTTAGLAAGSLLNFASDLALSRAYVVGLLAPVLVATAFTGTAQGYGVTAVIVIYLVFLLLQGAELNRDFFRSLDQLELLAARAAALDVSLARAHEAEVGANAANLAKSEFLANMSHELRTPMTAILGYADLLRCNDLPSLERITHAETILRNGEQLLRLLNEVLDLSKIEAGKMSVAATRCSVSAILADVESLMRVRAIDRKLELSVVMCEPIPPYIFTDATRLRQILINLVGNAIKFTDKGAVSVRAHYLDSGAKDGRLLIDVVDTGIGMSASQIECLFQAFSQVDGSSSRRFQGTGLGLYISKTLAGLLGGDITVQSEHGRGSTFTLALAASNLGEGAPGDSTPAPAPAIERDVLGGVRVLLAEDGKDNQRLIAALLKRAGADVVIADNGAVAVEKATSALADGAPYDVILMDMEMPVLNGYGAGVRLRDSGYKGPILALTAHAMEANRARCLAAGCDEHVTKPIDVARLIDAVARYSGRRAARSTPPIGAPLFSTFHDDEEVAALLPGFCQGLILKVAELRRAVAAKDAASIARVAHGLAGAGGSYGFNAISESGRRVEHAARAGEGSLEAGVAELIGVCERAVAAHAIPHAPRAAFDPRLDRESRDRAPVGSRPGIEARAPLSAERRSTEQP
jgi:signal transduction histidine kinase/CheY-like chemotaxis protein/HPt (histidine-containing phosphotransfer) domain-containing protein